MSFDATRGDHLAPGTVLAGHRIERVLRRRAPATLYRAVPVAPGTPQPAPMVLTVVDRARSVEPAFRDWFFRSTESAGATTHPALARIIGHGFADGHLWAATEPVPTIDAAGLLHRHRDGIDVDLAVGIVRVVGEALDAAHRRRLVHGGLTMSDILLHTGTEPRVDDVSSPGVVTVCGFGLAPPPDGEHTPRPDTDVAGLARVLVEMLTGTGSVARHRVSEAVSPAFGAVLSRALDPRPDHRHRTCSEFVRAADLALHLTRPDGEPATEVMSTTRPAAVQQDSPTPKVFQPVGNPGRSTEIVAARRPSARPPVSRSGSSHRSHRGSGRGRLVPLLVAAVVVAVCVGAVVLVGARNSPAPWPEPVAPIADAFPRLLPDSPDGAGWRDASCRAVSHEGVVGISCTDVEDLTYVVWDTAAPGARETVTASLKGYPGDAIKWRDGPASASRDSVADGWLVTNFVAPVHQQFTVVTRWPGHSGREILDAWWRTAPLG
ncbi:serine/threonine-protein kinase [Gordonia aurantiaca]|uniref:serine/threonine protein kinase n=1 Tax=Gordonia sp. B21 TaxID=3151852 RepID=UPI0032635133